MGGFAALIGGLGQGAMQYGNQVRGFLEARRTNLADTMLNLAAQEPDEQLRGEYLGHASKLLSGEPMAKMLPAMGKTFQDHLQQNQTIAQIFPPPSGQQQTYAGQAPLGQMSGTRVAEPTTAPPSAAMYPTSQVNPWAQTAQIEPIPAAPAGQATPSPIPAAGQQASIEPIPPAATSQPWAFAPTPPNIPGTTLPEGSAPQARMSAVPPVNPYAAAPQEMAPAGPQSYVDQVLQHPYMRTPAGRAILSPVLQQAAEMDRQLGISHQYVQQKMGYLSTYKPQLDQMYQAEKNPLMRSALNAHWMDMQAWAANPDPNARQPNFPLTGGNMLSAMRMRQQVTSTAGMTPQELDYYGIPRNLAGMNVHLNVDQFGDRQPGGFMGAARQDARLNTYYDPTTQTYSSEWGFPNAMAAAPGAPPPGVLVPPQAVGGLEGTTDTGRKAIVPKAQYLMAPPRSQTGSQFQTNQMRQPGLPIQLPFVEPSMMGSASSSTVEQTESGSKRTDTRRRIPFNAPAGAGGAPPAATRGGGTPPAATGGATTPPTTTGAPAPLAQIPGVNYEQVAAAVAQVTRPNLSIAESKALEEKLGVSSTGSLAKTPFARAYRQLMRQKAIDDPNNLITWDSPVAAMAQRSTQTLNEINRLESLIARMKQNNELGPLASRWNEFLTNHLGEDLSQNHDYVALANGLDLLSTALGFVHGGARGGGSIQMKESFQKHLNVARMDADTLLGAIGEEKRWLLGYSNPSLNNLGQFNLPTSTPGAGPITPAGGAGGASSKDFQDLMDKYVNKVKK